MNQKHFIKPQKLIFLFFLLITTNPIFSQTYTSYFTGNTEDRETTPNGGVCLMGGAREDDNAMKWFLRKASGGDVLVLRASGSDGYNDYLFAELNIAVNSVETIVFHSAMASEEAYIHQKIQQAEAIWFAGGDQWDYISFWRNTAIDSLINEAISQRNIVIGGTSAGMAIQGGLYFTAQNGTIRSAPALTNPFNETLTIDTTRFLANQYLSDVITDTHYDNPDRKGRHVAFLARILTSYGIAAKGIACDEHTAVCIEPDGTARVFGQFPDENDNAYFIQANCDVAPENCSPDTPLEWNLGNRAIKTYVVKGTSNGDNTFDLNTWETGTGGTWQNWYATGGFLREAVSFQADCSPLSTSNFSKENIIVIYPNPAGNQIKVQFENLSKAPKTLVIKNALGQTVKEFPKNTQKEIVINTEKLPKGTYFIEAILNNDSIATKQFILY